MKETTFSRKNLFRGTGMELQDSDVLIFIMRVFSVSSRPYQYVSLSPRRKIGPVRL